MDVSIKEGKKRFFRKGQSQPVPQYHQSSNTQSQRSLDNGLNHRPSQSPSIGSIDLELLPHNLRDPHTLKTLQDLQRIQALQNLHNLHIGTRYQQHQQPQQQNLPPRPPKPSSGRLSGTAATGSTNTNTGSLDEAELNMGPNRRYMPAPRRARSAERFDGMRVNQHNQPFNLSQGVGINRVPGEMRQGTDEMLSRGYSHSRSPQVLRQGDNSPFISGSSTPNSGPVNVTQQPVLGPGVRRPIPIVGVPYKGNLDSGHAIPSPPPSYTTATTEARDPPPYHQVVGSKGTRTKGMNRGSQSQTSTPTGNLHGQGIRSVASTPLFANIDNSCACYKCQEPGLHSNPQTDLHDAVYMESQAFLMHEIMTDGMAFCSIV